MLINVCNMTTRNYVSLKCGIFKCKHGHFQKPNLLSMCTAESLEHFVYKWQKQRDQIIATKVCAHIGQTYTLEKFESISFFTSNHFHNLIVVQLASDRKRSISKHLLAIHYYSVFMQTCGGGESTNTQFSGTSRQQLLAGFSIFTHIVNYFKKTVFVGSDANEEKT